MNVRISSLLVAAAALLIAVPSFAAPPADGDAKAEAPPAGDDAAPAPGAPPKSVGQVRGELESSMSTLGELANDALEDSDSVRAACVVDKRDRGSGVMELATADLMVATDGGADAAERNFALQKLEASAGRLEQLVEQARGCLGDGTPNTNDDTTDNEVDETQSVAIADPTAIGRQPPVPPPVDDSRPPTVGSPTR